MLYEVITSAYGRARHPFMTGTGGWAYYSATRYILGIRPEFESLVIDPCIPSGWSEFWVVREWRESRYRITIKNPDGVMKGVKQITIDGEVVDKINCAYQKPGKTYDVVVIMGHQQKGNEKGQTI